MTPPSTEEITQLIAWVHHGELVRAEHGAAALIERHPQAGIGWKVLGVARMRQGKDALAALRRAAALLPGDAEAHGNLGAALHDRGLWAEALNSLERSLELRPDDVQTLIDAANSARALGRPAQSVIWYRRALERDPRAAEARNNLGNALMELGDSTQAIACYQAALELLPQNALIHLNLGNALRRLGRWDEALSSIRRSLNLDPSAGAAHRQLALTLQACGQRQDAVASCRRALELQPNDVDAHLSLGNVLLELGRVEASLASYRNALALAPTSPTVHVGLAGALRIAGQSGDAQASCEIALAIDPRTVDALTLLGELQADRGGFADAQTSFRRALDLSPHFAPALCGMAAHRKMTHEDAAWLRRAQDALAENPTVQDETRLRFAIGKYYDDVAEYDRAFEEFRLANELAKRCARRYDREASARRVAEVLSASPSATISQPHASPSELPVFVIGMWRSGTSLAEQILASHPEVHGAGEVIFWEQAFDRQQTLSPGHAGQIAPGLTQAYLERTAARSRGARRIVDKMPINFLYAGLIHAAFPRARFIHMRRHPIDTCLSIYFQNFFNMAPYSNDLDDLAHAYGDYVRAMDHWRAVLPPRTLLEVPYEGLVQDQEAWSRRMIEFIGLPWEARCLEFHRTERVVITASRWQVRQKLNTDSAGRWRRYEKHLAPLRHLA